MSSRTSYNYDEDGYLIPIYQDSKSDKSDDGETKKKELSEDDPNFVPEHNHEYNIKVTSNSSCSSLENEINLPKTLVREIDSGTFNVKNYNITDIFRWACFNDFLKKFIKNHMDYNPLPIKSKLPNGSPIMMFEHQISTLEWMKERELNMIYGIRGGIIILKQGLGKSLITMVHSLIMPKVENTPTLILVSKTLLSEWKTQGFDKFFNTNPKIKNPPCIKVLYLYKSYGKFENLTKDEILKYDFVITTYETLMSVCKKEGYYEDTLVRGDEHSLYNGKVIEIRCRERNEIIQNVKGYKLLFGIVWNRIVADESPKFSNPKTLLYKCIMSLCGRSKWCLTGTPVRNYATDIWSQLRFCGYDGVSSAKIWSKQYQNYMVIHNLLITMFHMNYEDAGICLPDKINIVRSKIESIRGRML